MTEIKTNFLYKSFVFKSLTNGSILAIPVLQKPKIMKRAILNKAVLTIIFLACFLDKNLFAQQKQAAENADYTNAIGIRFGGTTGLDFKHKFSSLNAIELILGAYPNSFGLTALYERNVSTQVTGLNLYLGAGGHIARAYDYNYGYFKNDRYYYYRNYNYGPVLGIDGIAGVEYRIPKVPLAISVDVKPYAEFYSGYGTYFNLDPGLGIKFTF